MVTRRISSSDTTPVCSGESFMWRNVRPFSGPVRRARDYRDQGTHVCRTVPWPTTAITAFHHTPFRAAQSSYAAEVIRGKSGIVPLSTRWKKLRQCFQPPDSGDSSVHAE